LALVNSQNVWENIFLGNEYRRFGWLQKRKMQAESFKIIDKLGINIEDINSLVGNLSGGQRQAVAVARALLQEKKLLIFDEPTAAMGYKETMAVQQLIQALKAQGLAIIIISHNIQQIYSLADRICIMRQGNVVDTIAKDAVEIDDIITMIVSGVAHNGVA
jgi:ABC-type sugar transport system ATPase subunit